MVRKSVGTRTSHRSCPVLATDINYESSTALLSRAAVSKEAEPEASNTPIAPNPARIVPPHLAPPATNEEIKHAFRHFLDYAHSNPDGTVIFRATDMILQVDTDAAYLVAPKARSRAGEYHFLGNKDHTMFNGTIHILAKKAIKNMNAQFIMKYKEFFRIRTDNQSPCGVITGKMK